MSKNWGRTPVTNADKRHLTQMTYLAPASTPGEFEERIDRRPMGKVERFVDKEGNVLSLQMYTDGDDKKLATEQRLRTAYHAKGFVEHAKCPIKHGTRNACEATRKDFAKMPAEFEGVSLEGECKYDPRVMELVGADKRAGIRGDLHARFGCPHIQWLIHHRKSEAAKAYALRNAHVAELARKEAEQQENQRIQAELAREQLAERRSRKPKKGDE